MFVDGRETDAVVIGIILHVAHLGAFDSGELKIRVNGDSPAHLSKIR